MRRWLLPLLLLFAAAVASLDAFTAYKALTEPKPPPTLLCSVEGCPNRPTTPRRPGSATRFCAQHADCYD